MGWREQEKQWPGKVCGLHPERSESTLVIRLSSHLPGNLRKRLGSQTHIVSFVGGAKCGGMNWPSVLSAMIWQAGNLCFPSCHFPSVVNKSQAVGSGWELPLPRGLADPLLARSPAPGPSGPPTPKLERELGENPVT